VRNDDIRWPKLEKVWMEERLTLKQLERRFGIGIYSIRRYLSDRHGTADAAKYNGVKRDFLYYLPSIGD